MPALPHTTTGSIAKQGSRARSHSHPFLQPNTSQTQPCTLQKTNNPQFEKKKPQRSPLAFSNPPLPPTAPTLPHQAPQPTDTWPFSLGLQGETRPRRRHSLRSMAQLHPAPHPAAGTPHLAVAPGKKVLRRSQFSFSGEGSPRQLGRPVCLCQAKESFPRDAGSS